MRGDRHDQADRCQTNQQRRAQQRRRGQTDAPSGQHCHAGQADERRQAQWRSDDSRDGHATQHGQQRKQKPNCHLCCAANVEAARTVLDAQPWMGSGGQGAGRDHGLMMASQASREASRGRQKASRERHRRVTKIGQCGGRVATSSQPRQVTTATAAQQPATHTTRSAGPAPGTHRCLVCWHLRRAASITPRRTSHSALPRCPSAVRCTRWTPSTPGAVRTSARASRSCCARSTRRRSTCPTRSSATRTSRARRRSRPTARPTSVCTAARCTRCATRSAPATSWPRAGASILRAPRRGTPRRRSLATARSTSGSAPTTTRPMPQGTLYALQAPSAGIEPHMLWSVDLGPGRQTSSPTLGPDGTIYAMGGEGRLSAIAPGRPASSGRCRPARC